jgi:hypothetical protein
MTENISGRQRESRGEYRPHRAADPTPFGSMYGSRRNDRRPPFVHFRLAASGRIRGCDSWTKSFSAYSARRPRWPSWRAGQRPPQPALPSRRLSSQRSHSANCWIRFRTRRRFWRRKTKSRRPRLRQFRWRSTIIITTITTTIIITITTIIIGCIGDGGVIIGCTIEHADDARRFSIYLLQRTPYGVRCRERWFAAPSI